MNFSTWSIRYPVPAILLFIVLSVLGWQSFKKLGIQNFPDVELPTVVISTTMEGTAPPQLETEVTRKIENAVASLGQIKHISSTIKDSNSTTTINFEMGKDLESALSEVKNAVDRVRSSLPSTINTPIVSKIVSSGQAVVTYALTSDTMDQQDLSWFVDNQLTKAILEIKGVGEVKRIGGVDREIAVNVNPAMLTSLGVSVNMLSSALSQMEKDYSGGRGEVGGSSQSFRLLGAVDQIDQLNQIEIPLSNGRHALLSEMATITDTVAEPSSMALLRGKPVVAFQVFKVKGMSEVSVFDAVDARITTFKAEYPAVKIEPAFNTVTRIKDNFKGSMQLLFEGAILAIFVVWLFLRGFRETLLAAIALPLSILPTFLVMQWFGFTLNTLTLLALALIVGILVDDAIVEIENIHRHLEMGKSPKQASIDAADEIGMAVIATSFALIAVFLPTAFMGGEAGQNFKSFGITASVAVFASLMVARLLTPMMASYLLKPIAKDQHKPKQDSWFMRRYLMWVEVCLTYRWVTLIGVACFMWVAFGLVKNISTEFVPAADIAQTSFKLELPQGSTLTQTLAVTQQANILLKKVPDVVQVFSAIGGENTSSVNSATLTLNLTTRDQRNIKQALVEKKITDVLRELVGVRVSLDARGSGSSVKIGLAGSDENALSQASAQVMQGLRKLSGLGTISSGASMQRPEIHVIPNMPRLAEVGLTTADLASTIQVATLGTLSNNLPKLNLPERQLEIRVRLAPEVRQNLILLKDLPVLTSKGMVPLSSLATVEMGSGPAQIQRLDRERNLVISAGLNGRKLGDVRAEIDQLPEIQQLPIGVTQVKTGDSERQAELMSDFASSMIYGVLFIYIVLVLLFHDFSQPFTIIMALPLSFGGVFVALMLTGTSFSMPVMIGILMLMGLVSKNSILLVEYALTIREKYHVSRNYALLDACHKRARPIVMTTIAMIAGMLPIALGLGAEPSFRQPMAVAVIGGLITSTVLSLLVIPVVFSVIDDVHRHFMRLFKKDIQKTVNTDIDLLEHK